MITENNSSQPAMWELTAAQAPTICTILTYVIAPVGGVCDTDQ